MFSTSLRRGAFSRLAKPRALRRFLSTSCAKLNKQGVNVVKFKLKTSGIALNSVRGCRWFSSGTSSSSSSSAPPTPPATSNDTFLSRLFRTPTVSSPTHNKWKLVPYAFMTHICIGSILAWSLYNEPLLRAQGVFLPAADDWTLPQVVTTFVIHVTMQGVAAAVLGKWCERVGLRASAFTGSMLFGGGIMLGGFGVLHHNLYLLYLGWGLIAGIGNGIAYPPPVANLIKWFPDKKGLATGLTIMGYGGGALCVTPLKMTLFSFFSRLPQALSESEAASLPSTSLLRLDAADVARLGSTFADNTSALDLLSQSNVFLIGTGSTGAGEAMICIGTLYGVVMGVSAFCFRLPHPDAVKQGTARLAAAAAAAGTVVQRNVHVDNVMKTPQFWQVWVIFACLSSGGLSVLSVAKTMLIDIYGVSMASLVTGAFATSYVFALSAANLSGRLLWASLSDRIGRKNMFTMACLTSIPAYMAVPYCAQAMSSGAVDANYMLPLSVHIGATMLAISFFGSGYALTPPFEADLFGTRFVSSIHGRMMLASSFAGLFGPQMIARFRASAENSAVWDLSSRVDATAFVDKFGRPVSELPALIDAKVVTISRLLDIAPVGTLDPTPFLYNNAMYTCAGMMVIAVISNITIKPVDEKWKMTDEDEQAADGAATVVMAADAKKKKEV